MTMDFFMTTECVRLNCQEINNLMKTAMLNFDDGLMDEGEECLVEAQIFMNNVEDLMDRVMTFKGFKLLKENIWTTYWKTKDDLDECCTNWF